MADKKNAYGTTASDTSFRKTWDRAEYAQKAAVRETKERDEAKARYEAKLAGKRYVRRASTPPDVRQTEARTQRLDVGSMVGKTMLVPAGASMGKRGRGAGFYCEACDLTFKDNLQLVEHYNSKQHQIRVGESGEVKRAGVVEVRARLKWLKRKIEDEKKEELINLDERLEVAADREEREREAKRQKRREKRRKTKDGVGVKQADFSDDGVIR